MREKGIDYFENSRRATYAQQQQYAIDNPLKFTGYSKDCWGITASDGPGPDTIKVNGNERVSPEVGCEGSTQSKYRLIYSKRYGYIFPISSL